jgi:hypothetical protein
MNSFKSAIEHPENSLQSEQLNAIRSRQKRQPQGNFVLSRLLEAAEYFNPTIEDASTNA